jgi:hypothetical protein
MLGEEMASLGHVHLKQAVHRDDATPGLDRCGDQPAVGREGPGVDATVPGGCRARTFERRKGCLALIQRRPATAVASLVHALSLIWSATHSDCA